MLETTLAAEELLKLRPGDVVALGHSVNQPIDVLVGKISRFAGRLAQNGQSMAVRVESRSREGSGGMTSELSAALASELAGVFGALLDTPVVTTPTDEPADAAATGWPRSSRTTPAHGVGELCFDEVGAAAVTALIMGLDEAPPEASIADTLRRR